MSRKSKVAIGEEEKGEENEKHGEKIRHGRGHKLMCVRFMCVVVIMSLVGNE